MRKLSDFIESERLKSIELQAEIKRKNLNESMQKENFKNNFQNIIVEEVKYKLLKLKVDNKDFDIVEKEQRYEKEPFILKFEINITINHQIAQYFLTFRSNSGILKNGVYVDFTGSEGMLMEKSLLFDDVENTNFEEYLVAMLIELNKK
jgi:hypothetical protein